MSDTARPFARAARPAGVLLIVAASMTIFAMAHHPSGHQAGAGGGSSLISIVHATMIALLAVNIWGLSVFAIRLGGGLALAGLIAYAISFVANLGAATINGFIFPAVRAEVDHSSSDGVFMMLWQSNQVLAAVGVYAVSAALILWSLALIRTPPRAHKVIALLGLLAAFVPASMLAAGSVEMNVAGAMMIYTAHAVWIAAVGIQMFRSTL